ncbi:unnamed protein product [Closterium sp. NIES-54]
MLKCKRVAAMLLLIRWKHKALLCCSNGSTLHSARCTTLLAPLAPKPAFPTRSPPRFPLPSTYEVTTAHSYPVPFGPSCPSRTYQVATACAIGLGADKLICLVDGAAADNRESSDGSPKPTSSPAPPPSRPISRSTYEVATACAIGLGADKLICLLDGAVADNRGRLIRWMTLQQADVIIRNRATQSYAAAEYVKAVAGEEYIRSLGLAGAQGAGGAEGDAAGEGRRKKGKRGKKKREEGLSLAMGTRLMMGLQWAERSGRSRGTGSYQSSLLLCMLAGAVEGTLLLLCLFTSSSLFTHFHPPLLLANRGGVRRVHLLNSAVEGTLLLELYTRDGVGTMVSSDLYEGTRAAQVSDMPGIRTLLEPLEAAGVLLPRGDEQLRRELPFFTVVERDGHTIACAALFPFPSARMAEVAAFAVSPASRGNGRGDNLLAYLEKRAVDMGMEKLFLMTTRTADWFVHRGFAPCDLERLPEEKLKKVDRSRGSKSFVKDLEVSDEEDADSDEEWDDAGLPTDLPKYS